MGQRRAAGGRAQGGAGISLRHASRARLTVSGAALAGALLLAIYPAVAGRLVTALLIVGGVAVLILAAALALGRMAAVPGALALLGIEFVLALYVRETAGSFAAVAYGAALLVVAELAYWSLQLRTPSRATAGVIRRQAIVIAGLGVTSLAIGGVAAALSGAPVPGGLLLLAAGVGAIVAAVATVAAAIWSSGIEGRGRME